MPSEDAVNARVDTTDRFAWVEHERESAGRHARAISAHAPGWEQRHWTSRVLHRAGELSARSSAGMLAAISVAAWAVVGEATGFPRWWQIVLYSVTGSVTFVMVFVIQHTQERQTSAMQRKLDELIRSSAPADDTLIAVEGTDDEYLHALAGLNVADRKQAFDQAGEAD